MARLNITNLSYIPQTPQAISLLLPFAFAFGVYLSLFFRFFLAI